MKKLHKLPDLASVLGFSAELARLWFTQSHATLPKNQKQPVQGHTIEVYLVILVTTLKSQLQSDMLAEAQLTAERSDQVLFRANIIKSELLSKQPGLVSYLNWRFKTIHSGLVCSFGAFVQPKNQFKVDPETFKAEAEEIATRL